MSFHDHGVLITGAGDSVGRVTAEKFLAAGAKVHICDVREEAVQATLAANPGMTGTACSVGVEEEVDNLFAQALAAMGKVDVLINCVGIAGPHAPLEEITSEDWQTTFQVNVTGMFYTMRHAIPGMKQRRSGSIINFSSASTISCLPNRAAYVVSKYAVEGLTKNSARELGPYNVRCNAILPGAIDNARLAMVLERVARQKGISPQALLNYCKQHLPKYAVPSYFRFIADSEMPRTATHKIIKQRLRDTGVTEDTWIKPEIISRQIKKC